MERSCTFVPCDSTLHRIFSLYRSNKLCDVNARQRFNEIPDISDTVYQVSTSFRADKRLFTRHPTTRVVSEHKYPFTTLPQFTLSVHPCLALLSSVGVTLDSRRSFPLAQEIHSFMMWSHFRIPTAPSPCPSLTDDSTASEDSLHTVASTHSKKHSAPDNAAKTRNLTRHPQIDGRKVLGVRHMNTGALDVVHVDERWPTKRSRVVLEDVTRPKNVVQRRVNPSRAVWR
ncbi:hypothetical protein CYLTODRAFT_487705 [Cylindrobasidium torrendii FP15055 ss-10]|uniref:Uncharacterized protein n=1 Tax=Cylindrobasidium torrendii FP15055 ss-10 TaxID=1314674 RepID=A0A0D7BKS7_9AGAR|nr:hypothetical protein CYLTODRAFT_487705 [Cylindrobasidium torrendii FP15055 ss-10]